jgi:hypothetical protein
MQRINRYSKIITEGRMKTHSQGISFGTDGNLNNGQHRLIAVMKAGVPCDFYVTFGEDVSVFDAIDTGGTRSAKDALHIDGRKDLVCLAATVRIIINIERGALYSNGPEAQVENDEVVDFVNANEDVNECIKIGNRIRRKLAGSAAPLAAAIFLIRRDSAHPDRLEQFVEKLISGDNLSATSPILKLRDRISHRVDARDNGNTVSRNSHVVAAFIIAWNLWNAKKGGAIAWKHKTEAFPKIA